MFKRYILSAWRHLKKDKQFSILNLVGLSTGLACALLIGLWVRDELSVDKFNRNDDRLFQVLKRTPAGNSDIQVHSTTQGHLARSMARYLPEVAYATSVITENQNGVLSVADKNLKVPFQFVDQDFFHVFSYELLEGNKANVLSDISGVVISDRLALKMFHSTDVVHKQIAWYFHDDSDHSFAGTYKITGVFKAVPENATDQFDMLFAFDLYAEKNAGHQGDVSNWESNMAHTYVRLKEGADPDRFNTRIKDFSKARIKSLYGKKASIQYEDDLFIQRFSKGYLHNNFVNGVENGGRIEYVRIFIILALFIVLIACINFMNLSTAKASRRMKEIGIKKIVGASRSSLIFQHLSEAMIMAFSALSLAVLLAFLLQPAFTRITGKHILLNFDASLVLSALAITFITGLVAGSYPAFFLSGYQPVSIARGKLKNSKGESFIRQSLVVFQFAISVVLIISVIIIYQQMKMIQQTNLGYNKNQLIHFSNDGVLQKNLSPFLAAVKNIPGVIDASDLDGDLLGNASHSGGGIDWAGKDPNLSIEYYGNAIDNGCIETMGMRMAEGRSFSKDFSDSMSVIFNESAIKAMGLKDPVGKTVSLWREKKQIVGVVKDYHFESLYKKIGPAFFTYSPNNPTTLVKIQAGQERQVIPRIAALYSSYNNNVGFSYSFLDEEVDKMYASENRVASLAGYFSIVAVLISCLGVFGLAAFTAEKKRKEIGIRKVIGASVSSIVKMLSGNILILVGIACCIAIPVSWWAAGNWLQGFAYHISLSPLVFVVTALLVLLISAATISFQSIKAALADPAKSLRTE